MSRNVLDQYVEKVTINQHKVLERRIQIVLKDKPKWWPAFFYRYIVRRLIQVDKFVL